MADLDQLDREGHQEKVVLQDPQEKEDPLDLEVALENVVHLENLVLLDHLDLEENVESVDLWANKEDQVKDLNTLLRFEMTDVQK